MPRIPRIFANGQRKIRGHSRNSRLVFITALKGETTEIDDLVEKQADDEAAWEKPIRARRTRGASISIPPDLAARAAFLAKLHRKPNVEEWLTRVIQERIELEEAAFVGAKQDLISRAG